MTAVQHQNNIGSMSRVWWVWADPDGSLGWVFVIEVVPIQCSKLFKCMECVWSAVYVTVHYKKPFKSFDMCEA